MSFTLVKKSHFHIIISSFFMLFCATVLGTNTDKCYLNKINEGENILKRIFPLFGQTFNIEKNGFTYTFGICTDVPKSSENVSVIRRKDNEVLFLGRRNETHVLSGDTWVLLKYDCLKCPNNKEKDNRCLGNHSASIYIVCDPVNHEELSVQLTEEDDCNYKFILPTTVVCEHEKEISGATIFFILIIVAFFMYFIIGIIYKRLVHGAQGCQQLPHFGFWQRIGALGSDGCNYLCRCDEEPKFTWNNGINNFDSGDRDDALLKP